MLAIWNFAHVLTAAVYIAWWGLKVWMEENNDNNSKNNEATDNQ